MDYSSSGKSRTQIRKEYTPLMRLAAQGKADKIREMLSAVIKKYGRDGAKKYLQEEKKIDQALLLAVKNNHFEVAQLMVNCHPIELNLDIMDVDGNTPLMIAISHGDLKMVDLLIYAGATSSLFDFNKNKETALILAVNKGHQEIISRLLITMSTEMVAGLKKNSFYQKVIEKFEEEQDAFQKIHASSLAEFLKTYKPYQGKDTEVIQKYKQRLQAKTDAENKKKSSLNICNAFGKLTVEAEHSPKVRMKKITHR